MGLPTACLLLLPLTASWPRSPERKELSIAPAGNQGATERLGGLQLQRCPQGHRSALWGCEPGGRSEWAGHHLHYSYMAVWGVKIPLNLEDYTMLLSLAGNTVLHQMGLAWWAAQAKPQSGAYFCLG